MTSIENDLKILVSGWNFLNPSPLGIPASTSTESANFQQSVPKRNSVVLFEVRDCCTSGDDLIYFGSTPNANFISLKSTGNL